MVLSRPHPKLPAAFSVTFRAVSLPFPSSSGLPAAPFLWQQDDQKESAGLRPPPYPLPCIRFLTRLICAVQHIQRWPCPVPIVQMHYPSVFSNESMILRGLLLWREEYINQYVNKSTRAGVCTRTSQNCDKAF